MIRSFIWVVLLSVLLPAGAVAHLGHMPADRVRVSNDGRWVVFVSDKADLVPGQVDSNSLHDVFLHDRLTGTTRLVSRSTSGAAASGNAPLISADGSTVAFFSSATDLVPGQTASYHPRLFLYERSTGRIQAVSPLNGYMSRYNEECALSGDGRWVAYSMLASGLSREHIYLFDRFTGQSTVVDRSAVSPGQPSNGGSFQPQISADGRYIAFVTGSSDLLAGQSQPGGGFLYDRIEDTMIQATSAQIWQPRLSADGRWLAFLSSERDVIPGQIDVNGSSFDVFLWDRVTGGITLVSRSLASPLTTAETASSWSHEQSPYPVLFARDVISADGRWVAFLSAARDIAGEPYSSDGVDVFLFDRETGTILRASRTPSDQEPMWGGMELSDDGSRVVYVSSGFEEVPGQTGGRPNTFVYDRVSGTREIASRSTSSPTTSIGSGTKPAHISGDGRVVIFSGGLTGLAATKITGEDLHAYVSPLQGKGFYTVAPCRLLDTRQAGPALFSDTPRKVTATGSCGIPSTARALAANLTVLQSSGAGRLVAHPGDTSPEVETVDFATGETRAHHTTLALAFDGTGTVSLTPQIAGGGTVHVLLDVFGYYE